MSLRTWNRSFAIMFSVFSAFFAFFTAFSIYDGAWVYAVVWAIETAVATGFAVAAYRKSVGDV